MAVGSGRGARELVVSAKHSRAKKNLKAIYWEKKEAAA